jgi:hypothetical protein
MRRIQKMMRVHLINRRCTSAQAPSKQAEPLAGASVRSGAIRRPC